MRAAFTHLIPACNRFSYVNMACSATTATASQWENNAGVGVGQTPQPSWPTIELEHSDSHYDVLVVGGGIFGTTTAYQLKQAGKKVALLEGRTLGVGTTGFSTAKLSAQQGPTYTMISSQRGNAMARKYYDFNIAGINKVKQLIKDLDLDCELESRSHATFASDPDAFETIQKEFDKCKELDIPCRMLDEKELSKDLPESVGAKMAVCFDDMAQFNSYRYCIELAKHIDGDGCAVFENSMVEKVNENSDQSKGHSVHVNGVKISGDKIVLATHMPIMDRSLHFTILEPSRAYCIAARVGKKRLHNMFVSADEQRSLRTTQNDEIVVVCGESHPIGDQTETYQAYETLEKWTKEHFDVNEIVTRWAAMDYYSVDHCPFIGYLYRGTQTIFTGTGFSKWGLSTGAAGAMLVADLIDNKENEYLELVDARRWDLLVQYKGLLQEGFKTTSHLVGDKIKQSLTIKGLDSLENGEGGIVRKGVDVVGAYRDDSGKLHVVEPVCTHLKCNLVFNRGEVVWDCPCHGSQFDVDGKVLHGPATTNLKNLSW